MTELPKPDYARNMRIVGHTDQGGRPDGVQVMVHRGFAYIGHMFSKGFSIIDVRDAKNPRAVNYVAAPPNTWNIHLQVHDDLLLVIHAKDMFAAAEFADERAYYSGALGKTVGTAESRRKRDWDAGLAVYDISKPETPRRIGFMPVEGGGIHRVWYAGGRWAFASVLLDGFLYGFDNVGSAGPVTHLNCVEIATGRKVWQQQRFGKGNLIAADGKLFMSTMKGELVVARASPKVYEELGRATVLGSTRQAPALAGGLLYLRDDREIMCFDVRDTGKK